ncbi:hypothetical protein QBC41DRAFT_17582 [Cercophora samala]|uniref:Secreted protein n=1 Tax=Cercophora samala TaxID=330535 RepID=A0AA40D672_9PEZI|nr:hypothetical protein QBC41DRAFT_17582 [Cercophora samala]
MALLVLPAFWLWHMSIFYARGISTPRQGLGLSEVWGSERQQSRSLSRTCHFSPQEKSPGMRIIQIDHICRNCTAASPKPCSPGRGLGSFACLVLPNVQKRKNSLPHHLTTHETTQRHHDNKTPSAHARPSTHLPPRGRYDVSGPLYASYLSKRHYAQGRANAADAGGLQS